MPDKSGELTIAERQKIVDFFTEKNVKKDCPACGHSGWAVGTHMVLVPVQVPTAQIMSPYGYPAIFVACEKCAFLRFHAASYFGLSFKETEAKDGQ